MSRRLGLSGVAALVFLASATAAWAQALVGVVGIASEVVAVEQRLQDVREVTVRGVTFRVGTLNGRQVAVGLVIRSITDRADGGASGSYDRFRGAASENLAALVMATIARWP